jgi:hypothetical protein
MRRRVEREKEISIDGIVEIELSADMCKFMMYLVVRFRAWSLSVRQLRIEFHTHDMSSMTKPNLVGLELRVCNAIS